jgi:hypothetical protein
MGKGVNFRKTGGAYKFSEAQAPCHDDFDSQKMLY